MRHQPKRQKRPKNRGGAAMVEYAICLPILLALLFGLLEFARMTQLQQTARLAAFEGARAGITLNSSTADVKAAVNHVMSAVAVSTFTTTVTPATLGYTSPTVTVNVSVPAQANAWFHWFVPNNTTISASITLSREVQAVSSP